MEQRDYCFWLASVLWTAPHVCMEIIQTQDLSELFGEPKKLQSLSILEEPAKEALAARAQVSLIQDEIGKMREQGIGIVSFLDETYPEYLRDISAPPLLLYVKGDLKRMTAKPIAVVGARLATRSGMRNTQVIAGQLAESGVTIVSGMARGIDTSAHAGALEAGGVTIAVLGSGVDVIYPKENQEIYEKICQTGAVISEFPLKTGPYPQNFPIRNRIISGISRGILVTEGRIKSGAQITVSHALDQGRDVFALPTDISLEQSQLPSHLIRQGCEPIFSAKDILDYYHWDSVRPKSAKPVDHFEELDFLQKSIYNLLMQGDLSSQELLDSLNEPVSSVASALTFLEIAGLIERLPGKIYSIKK